MYHLLLSISSQEEVEEVAQQVHGRAVSVPPRASAAHADHTKEQRLPAPSPANLHLPGRTGCAFRHSRVEPSREQVQRQQVQRGLSA